MKCCYFRIIVEGCRWSVGFGDQFCCLFGAEIWDLGNCSNTRTTAGSAENPACQQTAQCDIHINLKYC